MDGTFDNEIMQASNNVLAEKLKLLEKLHEDATKRLTQSTLRNNSLSEQIEQYEKDLKAYDCGRIVPVSEECCITCRLNLQLTRTKHERDELQVRVNEMQNDLLDASRIFEGYAQLHQNKGTEEGTRKAQANQTYADRFLNSVLKSRESLRDFI